VLQKVTPIAEVTDNRSPVVTDDADNAAHATPSEGHTIGQNSEIGIRNQEFPHTPHQY